ncbi:hypothetical protein [Enterococcus sp. DIV0187]|uniref:hypothetical protein n=1 Tax=Enterococcus sp. DIV0187 TaxID=2774644 RepID=UPI003F25FD99
MKTKLKIRNTDFYINDEITYSEIHDCNYKGLLLNARFVQGVFDDKANPDFYNRFGKKFDPDTNVEELIESLDEWYESGLRAFTLGIQGGGPCFSFNDTQLSKMRNNPFSSDGKTIDMEYLKRLKRVLNSADEKGMVVILSLFYAFQSNYLSDDNSVLEATKTICTWLREQEYKNIIIEIANEHDIKGYNQKIFTQEHGIVRLIEAAQEASGGMYVGCSGTGGYFSEIIAEASDVVIIHGNGTSRNRLYNLLKLAKNSQPRKPILINEDSQALSQLPVCLREHVSWGYYNNMTKQEPPINWGITKGEDQFFALRMKEALTGEMLTLPIEDQFYLQGLERNNHIGNKRFIRLASLYPEKINYVEFYRDDVLVERAYDDPFMINFHNNWRQKPVFDVKAGENWKAKVYLSDGTQLIKEVTVE